MKHLNTHEKRKADVLKKRVHAAETSVKRLKAKIRNLTEDHDETIDSEFAKYNVYMYVLCTVMMSRSKGPTQKGALIN